MRNQTRSFRMISLVVLLALTLGVAGLVSAQSGPPRQPERVALQTVEPTAIDINEPVKLTFNKAETTPLDNDQVSYRNFIFSGKANQIVSVTVQRITGNLSFYFSINSQSSVELARASGLFAESMTLVIKLPQDGNYKFQVNSDNPGAGDFAAGSVSVLVSDGKASAAATAQK